MAAGGCCGGGAAATCRLDDGDVDAPPPLGGVDGSEPPGEMGGVMS